MHSFYKDKALHGVELTKTLCAMNKAPIASSWGPLYMFITPKVLLN